MNEHPKRDFTASRRNDEMEKVPAKRKDDLYIELSERVPFFGGSKFAASGQTVVYVLLAAIGVILAVGLGWIHEQNAEERQKELLTVASKNADADQKRHDALMVVATEIVKAMRVQTYVMTLSDPQRQRLDLSEPPEIRELREYRQLIERLKREEQK